MKTKVRIVNGNFESSNFGGSYKHLHIQILQPSYIGSEYLEPAGKITFQADNTNENWYALNFEIATDKPESIKNLYEIARHVKKNCCYNSQPNEILHLIGAIEYTLFHSIFIPLSYSGMNYYKITYKEGTQIWKYIFAVNELEASKICDKLNEDVNETNHYKYELIEANIKLIKIGTEIN